MAIYKPRTSAPAVNNKYYMHYSNGGYNTCKEIDTKTGSVLPNCVGYCQGRILENTNCNKANWKLPACDAEDWFETAKKNGLPTGLTPKLGASICWKQGQTHNTKDGAGHVATVEAIRPNGDLECSNSARNGQKFYMTVVKKADGYNYNGKQFQGFIYCGIDFTSKTVLEVANEVIQGKWGTGADRKNRLEAAGYNYSEVQKKVDELLKAKTPVVSKPAKKSNEEIAKEVIAGKWGVGQNRKILLKNAGYDYATIQNLVNKMLK